MNKMRFAFMLAFGLQIDLVMQASQLDFGSDCAAASEVQGNCEQIDLNLDAKLQSFVARLDEAIGQALTVLDSAIVNRRSGAEIRLLVKALIDAKVDFSQYFENHFSPLHWAIAHKEQDIIELLIGAGFNFDSIDKSGRTPLQVAVDYHNERAMKLFVDKLIETGQALTVLDSAIENNSVSRIELMIPFLTLTKEKITELLKWAIKNRYLLVIHLLAPKISIEELFSLLALAIKSFDKSATSSMIEMLKHKKADFNSKEILGKTLLELAIENNNQSAIKLLIDAGARTLDLNFDAICKFHFKPYEQSFNCLKFFWNKYKKPCMIAGSIAMMSTVAAIAYYWSSRK